MKNKKIKPITKAPQSNSPAIAGIQRDRRNLETTLRLCSGQAKKDMVFYRTPFFFRVFVPRQNNGGQASCFRDEPLGFILYSVFFLHFFGF